MNKLLHISFMSILVLVGEVFSPPSSVFAAPSNIVAAEYFVDTDLGEGNGIELTAKDGAFDSPVEDVEFSLDTSHLKIGLHSLFIRMQNDEGLWGTPRKIIFGVTGEKYITAAEYFIDSDSGCGNGTPIPPSDGSFDEAEESVIPIIHTSDLSPGLHTVHIRMKDSEDHWGTTRGYTFEVLEPLYITGAECYIDDDPGAGSGTPLNASDGSFDSPIENMEVTFSTCGLSLGSHTLFVRATDSYLRWGEPEGIDFEVTEAIVDCECDLNHDGRCDMQDWLLFGEDWGRTDCNEPGLVCECDVNHDCRCDMQDWLLFGEDWGRTDCP